jgi:Predicted periplasmic protein (DUF2092)
MDMHRLLTTTASLAGLLSLWQRSLAEDSGIKPAPRAKSPRSTEAHERDPGCGQGPHIPNQQHRRSSRQTGQFITLFATSEIALERPNKLRARVTGEVPNFDFTYDGGTIGAYAPNNNVYSVSKAPGTIDAMLPSLRKRPGFTSPRPTSSSVILTPCLLKVSPVRW